MTNTESQGAECKHDPDLYRLMVGETAENPSKGEPKSVICGGCGKTWHIASAARELSSLRETVGRLTEELRRYGGVGAVNRALTSPEEVKEMKTIAEAEALIGKYINAEAIDPDTGEKVEMGGVLIEVQDEGDDAWIVVDYGYGMSLRYVTVLEEDSPEEVNHDSST